MGVHKCIKYAQLACFGSHYECWKVNKAFRVTYAPLQMLSVSGKALCISAEQWNEKPHTAAITTAWLRSRRVPVLNWPACSPGLSPIKNIWCIIKWEKPQRRPQTLQQLEIYIRQEWDQITTPKLHKLITSIPRYLQTVFKKKRRCYTMVNMPPSQLIWDL